MHRAIWKRNNSRAESYRCSRGSYVGIGCGKIFPQKIKRENSYRTYNIIYYCWFLRNTLTEKVSHLGEKHPSKQVGLSVGQKMEIGFLLKIFHI